MHLPNPAFSVHTWLLMLMLFLVLPVSPMEHCWISLLASPAPWFVHKSGSSKVATERNRTVQYTPLHALEWGGLQWQQ
jgi:hypothetical protein